MTNEALVKRIDERILRERTEIDDYYFDDGLILLLQQARDAIPVWRSVETDGLPEYSCRTYWCEFEDGEQRAAIWTGTKWAHNWGGGSPRVTKWQSPPLDTLPPADEVSE